MTSLHKIPGPFYGYLWFNFPILNNIPDPIVILLPFFA